MILGSIREKVKIRKGFGFIVGRNRSNFKFRKEEPAGALKLQLPARFRWLEASRDTHHLRVGIHTDLPAEPVTRQRTSYIDPSEAQSRSRHQALFLTQRPHAFTL